MGVENLRITNGTNENIGARPYAKIDGPPALKHPNKLYLFICPYIWAVANVDDKNFGLSEAAFNDLKDKLSEGDEQLFEHVFLRHFNDCLVYVMREDKAPEHLAYDAVMDAFLNFRKKILEGKITYGNLRYLLTRMGRQHYYRRAKKEATTDLEGLPELSESPNVDLDPSATELLQKGWAQLGEKCKKLLHAFYYLNQELKAIASATGRKPDALRKQKQRCVDQLRGLVGQEG